MRRSCVSFLRLGVGRQSRQLQRVWRFTETRVLRTRPPPSVLRTARPPSLLSCGHRAQVFQSRSGILTKRRQFYSIYRAKEGLGGVGLKTIEPLDPTMIIYSADFKLHAIGTKK